MEEFSLKSKPELTDLDELFEPSPEQIGQWLTQDYPIFQQLNRDQLLVTIGALALCLSNHPTALDWQHLGIPVEVNCACTELIDEQLQILLHCLTDRLQSMPIPCDFCGGTPREPETGFCARCNQMLNGPAAAIVCRDKHSY